MSECLHIKCVVLGEANIGKTSIINRYFYGKFFQFCESTIGCSFCNKSYKKGSKTYKLDVWDTAGQEKYRGLMPMYYRNADIIFICLDLSVNNISKSIENYKYWEGQINKNSDRESQIIVIVGTKEDNRDVNMTEENIRGAIENDKYLYFETSALKNTGIDEMFQSCVNLKIEHIETAATSAENVQIGGKLLNLKDAKKKFNCC